MAIRVYHTSTQRCSDDERVNAMFGFTADHREHCTRLWQEGKYDLVARVQAEDTDHAYGLTNSIERHWSENISVEALPGRDDELDGHRSTSVGDCMVMPDGTVWVVSSFGFNQLAVEPEPCAV